MMVLLLETLNDIITVSPSIFSQSHTIHDASDIFTPEDQKNSTGGLDDHSIHHIHEAEELPKIVLLDIDTQTDNL